MSDDYGSVSHLGKAKKDLLKEVHRLCRLGVRLESSPDAVSLVHYNTESYLMVEVKYKQHLDLSLMDLKESVLDKMSESNSLRGNGVLRYQERFCFPDVDGLRIRS